MDDDQSHDQAEFEQAFKDAAAGPASPAADHATDTAAQAQAAQAADHEAAAQAAAQDTPQAGAEGASQAPAAKPAATPAPTADELQRQLQDALHRERSSANRISAFARQAEEAKQRAAALERQLKERETAPAKPAPANIDDVLTQAPELQAAVERRLSQAVEPLKAALDAANARLQELGDVAQTVASQVDPLVSREVEREQQATERRLDEAFGNWRDTVRNNDFKAWLNRQPEAVRTLYQNGRTYEEAATVLKLFNADKPAAPASTAQPAATPAAGSAAANQDRLRQAVGVRSSTVPRMAPKADDFEGAFSEFSRKR